PSGWSGCGGSVSPLSETAGRVVAAAGGLLWRPGADGAPVVAVVHRPKYDDWSLPKGKLEPGEHPLTAAAREVREETGFEVLLRVCDETARAELHRIFEAALAPGVGCWELASDGSWAHLDGEDFQAAMLERVSELTA
ncbi:MAG TPA: NUDIX domain-containing protein, partial [Blastococcus sp.]